MNKHKVNKATRTGRKPPFTQEQVQLVKLSLKARGNLRDLVLFCVGIDSGLRGIDLVSLKVGDVYSASEGVAEVFYLKQSKTGKSVSCVLSKDTRDYLMDYINNRQLSEYSYLFISLYDKDGTGDHITPDHYRDLIKKWMKNAGLDPRKFASHSVRRSRVSFIYKKTGNLRACQLLLGHSNIQNTAIYLGVEEEEAHEIARRNTM